MMVKFGVTIKWNETDLLKPIDEVLDAYGGRGCRPIGLVFGLRRATGQAGLLLGIPARLLPRLLLVLVTLLGGDLVRNVSEVLARWHLVKQLVLALPESKGHLLREVKQLLQILQLLRAPRLLRLRPLLQLCSNIKYVHVQWWWWWWCVKFCYCGLNYVSLSLLEFARELNHLTALSLYPCVFDIINPSWSSQYFYCNKFELEVRFFLHFSHLWCPNFCLPGAYISDSFEFMKFSLKNCSHLNRFYFYSRMYSTWLDNW